MMGEHIPRPEVCDAPLRSTGTARHCANRRWEIYVGRGILSRPIKAEAKGCRIHDPDGYDRALRTVEEPHRLTLQRDRIRRQWLDTMDAKMQRGKQ